MSVDLIAVTAETCDLIAVTAQAYEGWLELQDQRHRNWLRTQSFSPKSGNHLLLPALDGSLEFVLVIADPDDLYALASCAKLLPAGRYRLKSDIDERHQAHWMLGWQLAQDQFIRYKRQKTGEGLRAELLIESELPTQIGIIAEAVKAARAMVNTPAEDMGPEQLQELVGEIARESGAGFRAIVGEQLLQENFPSIHAVGRASHRAPRLLELRYGKPGDPLIAIVGKGVCFDTGGLDIKPADGMGLMKKDMGGSAVAIQLAQALIRAQLPIQILLLVPAVENAIGPNAYRPGDVINTRAGKTVEVSNTDAEGRVILADALTYAQEFAPDLMINFATLTGAARIALGPDLPAVFSNHDELVRELVQTGLQEQDPLWHMPLWQPYKKMLASSIADFNNAGASRMAGCITAALYLQYFVNPTTPWVHIDTYCWNDSEQPGRPKGGACQSLRAVFAYLSARFSA